MNNRLIIAEKPSMGKEIAEALGKPHKRGDGFIETADGIVTWCIGHIMKSFEPGDYNPEWGKWKLENLPMIPKDWQIKVDDSKKKQFKTIKDLLSKCDSVVNAGDPGREGQLIVDEVLFYLNNRKPVQRVLLYSLDKATVLQAFANLENNTKYYPIYEAGICRGYADWLMGMNATVAFTLIAQKSGYQGVLSVGRVQSPTLAIVVRRDEIIENFVPQDYFVVSGLFNHRNTQFTAFWKPQDSTPASWLDEEGRLKDRMIANSIASKVKGQQGFVKDYEEKEGKEAAPLPFNLAKLTIYANAKWGMGAKEVLDVCQSLYETHKLQSYPRTDCQYLPENQFGEASQILNHISQSHPQLGNAVNGANPNLKGIAWNDAKLAEHYGLIPTKKQADLSQLSDKERKIYQAVCERYIAQFYPPCEFKTAAVVIECEQEIFKATGKVITKPGWRQIFNNEEEQDEKKDSDDENQIFPEMRQGDNVLCQDSKCMDKKTTPPPRFTEGTLLKAMTNVHTLVSDPVQKQKLKDKKGIGTAATAPGILETLFKRNFFIKQGKQLISSPAGRALIHALPEKITNPALTAVWEDALDGVSTGKISSSSFKEKQNQWISQLIDVAKTTTISNLPQGGANNGKSSGGKSSAGASKSNYTKAPVKSGSSSTSSAKSPSGAKSKGTCPKCKTGTLYENTTKTGKKVIGCSNWNKNPKCDYVEWPK